MKTYLAVTGALFGLLTLAHLLRIALEAPQLGRDPWYLAITLVAALLCLWAWRLYRRWPAS